MEQTKKPWKNLWIPMIIILNVIDCVQKMDSTYIVYNLNGSFNRKENFGIKFTFFFSSNVQFGLFFNWSFHWKVMLYLSDLVYKQIRTYGRNSIYRQFCLGKSINITYLKARYFNLILIIIILFWKFEFDDVIAIQ